MDASKVSENDKKELEYQYSPSRWSKRLNAEAVIRAHVCFVREESEKVRESVPHEVLRYGEGENQLIDLFGTSLSSNSPVLVYVHGGYWQDLGRTISAYVVEPLFNAGIRVAVVGYDLAPKVTLGHIVEEMEQLDKFLMSWSAKTGVKFWYAGHSAGAYLIATVLKNRGAKACTTENCPIRGMVFISGIYELVPLVDTYVNDNLKLTSPFGIASSSKADKREAHRHRRNALGNMVEDDKWRCLVNLAMVKFSSDINIGEARQRSLTEIKVRDLTDMKFIIAVAEYDSDEFRRQSKEFYEMLHKQNPTAEYLLIKQTDHFDVVEKLNDNNYELTQKIVKLILGK